MSIRARLSATAVALLLISLALSVALTHQEPLPQSTAYAATTWAEQASFWLGIVSAAGALAVWLVEELRQARI